MPDTVEENLKHLDDLGSPTSYNHYNTGWAWAFDTPFPYWKRWAGYEGGAADMCMVSWPKGIAARGEVRHQYMHAVDLVPTIYELLGIEPPEVIKGYPQSPIEGESFVASLTDPGRSRARDAVLLDARHAGDLPRGLAGQHAAPADLGLEQLRPGRVGALRPREDRARRTTWRATNPSVLERLKGLWFYNAGIYKGLPLDDRMRARDHVERRGRSRANRAPATCTTRTAPTCPSRWP